MDNKWPQESEIIDSTFDSTFALHDWIKGYLKGHKFVQLCGKYV